jgi:hypothetical protein
VAGSNTTAQKLLLATQIALTLALVAGAALFGASIRNMYKIDLGIKPGNVWSALLIPRPGGYSNFTPAPYYRDLERFFESLGAQVIAGEDFRPTDQHSSETMVILSKSLVERLGNPRELIGHQRQRSAGLPAGKGERLSSASRR